MPDTKSSVQLRFALTDFGIEVPGNSISAPRLVIEGCLPLRLSVSHGILHHLLHMPHDIHPNMIIGYLEVSALRGKPFIDKFLWVVGKAQVELSLKLDVVDLFHCVLDL